VGLAVALLLGIFFAGLGALLLLIGIFIYTLVPIFRQELAKVNYGGYITILSLFVVATVFANIVVSIIALPGLFDPSYPFQLLGARQQMSIPDLVLGTIVQAVIFIALVYLRDIRTGVFSWADLGLKSRSLSLDLGWGIAGGIGVLLLSALIGLIMEAFGNPQDQLDQFSAVKNAGLPQFVIMLIAAGILAPFWEELFFRGYIFTSFRNQKGLWQGLIFSAAIFAVVHANLAALLPIFVLGLSLAAIRHYSDSLIPAMIAHAFNNIVAIIALYIGVQ
jgi:membrane protease YdiL (CAAX protease family)